MLCDSDQLDISGCSLLGSVGNDVHVTCNSGPTKGTGRQKPTTSSTHTTPTSSDTMGKRHPNNKKPAAAAGNTSAAASHRPPPATAAQHSAQEVWVAKDAPPRPALDSFPVGGLPSESSAEEGALGAALPCAYLHACTCTNSATAAWQSRPCRSHWCPEECVRSQGLGPWGGRDITAAATQR